MEWANFNYIYWGLAGFAFWCVDFFKIINKPRIVFPNINEKVRTSFPRLIVFLMGALAWGLLTNALMQPRKAMGFDKTKIEVNDILIVVDVSRSMFAEDFKPNRLEAAKEKIREFVEMRPTDRIGIIMFSEKAFTLLPLSTDLELVRRSVDDIKIGFLGMGTNIGDALGLAVARATQSLAKNKVIILLTDGVSNVGSMTPVQAAEEAKKKNIKVYSIGIGKLKNSAVLKLGGSRSSYQRIPGGSVDIDTLEKIAKITKGKSFYAKDSTALKLVLEEIQNLEKTEIEKSNRIIYKELYLKYLLAGLILLVLTELLRRFYLKEAQ